MLRVITARHDCNMSFDLPILIITCLLASFAIQTRADCISETFAGICNDNELCQQTCVEEGHIKGHCKSFRKILLCYCKGCESVTEKPSAQSGTHQLKEIFRDDFNGRSIDNKKWTVYTFPDELYQAAPDDVWEEGGFLFIQSQRRTYGARNFTSGYVDTRNKFKFLYGTVEWGAKCATGRGIHTHFVLSAGQEEIMVMVLGDHQNMIEPMSHYQSPSGTIEISSQQLFGSNDYVGDFHKFTVIWKPDEITWLVDGHEIWSITDPAKIPQQEALLTLYLHVVGPSTDAVFNNNPFPMHVMIDYITVYQ